MERIVPKNLEEAIELYKNPIMLNLKPLPLEEKTKIIKYVLTEGQSIEDPLMILNILNLVKVYNTLDDEYFKSEDVYVNSVEEFLDLKLAIANEIKEFTKKLCIYFLSIIKSYNKFSFTAADERFEIPSIYRLLIMSTDFITLAGIFSKCPVISTDELIYVNDAYNCMTSLISKSTVSTQLLNDFFNQFEEVKE